VDFGFDEIDGRLICKLQKYVQVYVTRIELEEGGVKKN
jgi:hypothetical protein